MNELNLNELTVEQKLGQLIVARCVFDKEEQDFIIDMAKKKCVGGLQMSICEKYGDFISKVREAADYPLLICSDMENGYPGAEFKFPSQMGIASANDTEIAYNLGRLTAIEAKKAGVGVAWGPDLDLAAEGALCRITRCFSDDIDTVTKFAVAMIKGMQDEGIVVTAKHFPGGHDMLFDPHMKLEASKMTEEELMEKDIEPYLAAMREANLSGIMTGHGFFPKIDPEYIASLSPKIIGMIRSRGFDGIIMTDSFAMMAIVKNYAEKEIPGLAIAAGNDMILPNYRISFKKSFEYLKEAYDNGVITEQRLNDAVRHVIEAQHKTLQPPKPGGANPELIEAVSKAYRKSICAINSNGHDLKLSPDTKKLFVLLCENAYPDVDGASKELEVSKTFSRRNCLIRRGRILKEFPGSDVIIINEFPCQAEIEEVCRMAYECDEVIFYIFCYTSSYLASDGITERIKNLINANEEKISVIIHMGNPYEIKKYKNSERILAMTYTEESDSNVIDILKGNYIPEGKLPVKL